MMWIHQLHFSSAQPRVAKPHRKMPMSPETQSSSVLQTEWTPDQLPAAFRLARSRIM